MIQLMDISKKTLLRTEQLESMEANTAQFIQSSFKIIDNMRLATMPTDVRRIHSEGVILSLDKLLSQLVAMFKEHEERKLDRAVHKKTHLRGKNLTLHEDKQQTVSDYSARSESSRQAKTSPVSIPSHPSSANIKNAGYFPIDAAITEPSISPTHILSSQHPIQEQQLKFLQREKVQMQLMYNKELEEISKIEETLLQISNMQNLIERQVSVQADQIESIYDASWEIQATICKGNEQLLKAKKNSSDFKLFLVVFLLVLALSLVFLNWYK